MKIKVWIINTCVPSGIDPVFPKVCGTEAEAEAYADKMLREEWASNGPEDPESGERLPYPGDWRTAQEAIVTDDTDMDLDVKWGRWEITSHEIDAPMPAPVVTVIDNARGLIEEAITTHIYDEDNGDVIPPDDPYTKCVADLTALIDGTATAATDADYLARFPEDQRETADRAYQDGYIDGVTEASSYGSIAVILAEGLVQQVVADGALIGLPVTIIDYDVEGAEEDRLIGVDQGDGTTTSAWVQTITTTKAGIVIPVEYLA